MQKTLAIFFSLAILSQAIFFKKKYDTYFLPSSIMAFAWTIFTFFPLIIMYQVPINPISIIYIFLCVLAFSVSSLHFDWKNALSINENENNNLIYNNSILLIFFSICFLLSLFFSTKAVLDAGFEFYELISNVRKVSRRFAEMRPSGMITYGISGILSILFTYITATLGSFLFFYSKNSLKKILFFFLLIFPALYCMSIQSSKLIFYNSIGFFLGGYILVLVKNKKKIFSIKKIVLSFSLVFLFLIPFFIFAFASRNRLNNIYDILELSFNLFKSYAFAELYAFADFFSFLVKQDAVSTYQNDLNSHGAYTFTSIYNSLFTPKQFPPGTYYDFYEYKNVLRTNIFTIFRGLINDFGIYGTIVYMYLTGLISNFIFYILLKKKSHLANALFISFVVYIQGMYLASVFMARFMYLTLIVLYLIFCTIDFYSNRQSKKNHLKVN